MPLYIIIYTALMIRAIMLENLLYIGILLLFGLLTIGFLQLYKRYSIRKTRDIISKIKDGTLKRVTPFINVNRVAWYIIQELPGFNRIEAKKVIWNRKYNGRYTSVDDFFRKNPNVDEESKQLISKVIKFK